MLTDADRAWLAQPSVIRGVAEGGETGQPLDVLVCLGCNACPGFWGSPGLPAAAFECFIARRTTIASAQ